MLCFPWPICPVFLSVGQQSFRDPELEQDFMKVLMVVLILGGRGSWDD